MGLYKNIFLIIGLIALPLFSFGQCLTLSEPLFLQAPDSICATQKALVLKTSKAKESGAKYLWRTPIDSIITTDSILRIDNPSARYSGDYYVSILLETCRSAFFGPINVQVIGVQKTKADTLKTLIACKSAEINVTSAFKTDGKITGQWLGTEGVTFDKPNAPTTTVKGLKVGENMAIWVLSTSVCPFFVKDTFLIRHEIAPVLETDGVILKAGEASKTIHLGQVAGSNLNLIKDVSIVITKPPRNGSLEILSDGKRLKYKRGASFQGQDAFAVQVCNLKCLNLCSAPIAYTVDVQFDERYPNVTMPKMLAPQDVGEAHLFKIEKVEDYPENELKIMNRWGNVLAQFSNYKNTTAWDGTKDNNVLSTGAYYYIFQAKDPKGKPLKALSGIFYIVNQ